MRERPAAAVRIPSCWPAGLVSQPSNASGGASTRRAACFRIIVGALLVAWRCNVALAEVW